MKIKQAVFFSAVTETTQTQAGKAGQHALLHIYSSSGLLDYRKKEKQSNYKMYCLTSKILNIETHLGEKVNFNKDNLCAHNMHLL